jgi:hypothetical protein
MRKPCPQSIHTFNGIRTQKEDVITMAYKSDGLLLLMIFVSMHIICECQNTVNITTVRSFFKIVNGGY